LKLRKYQKKTLKQINKSLKKHDHVLLQAPTGFGKTVLFSSLCEKNVNKSKRILIIVPRIKLLNQISKTLMSIGIRRLDINIIQGNRKFKQSAPIHLAMINTLHGRVKKNPKYLGDIDVVVIDEVHIGHNKSMYKTIMDEYWNTSKWLGVSATPMDDKGYLLKGYDDLVCNYQTADLVEMGYLLDIKIYKEKSPDLNDVGMVGGDYNQKDLGDLMGNNILVGNAVGLWKSKFEGKKTMVFCVNIEHAKLVEMAFKHANIPCVLSHSKQSDRMNDKAHELFEKSAVKILISINKLTAGFDDPSVEVLLALRPTKTKSLMLQAVGRVLRPHPSMDKAIIVDCAGWYDEFGHPFQRLDLELPPPPKEKVEMGEAKLKKCHVCKSKFKADEVVKEIVYSLDGVTLTIFCPVCQELIDEQYTEYRNIGELEEIPDPTITLGVTSTMISNFAVAIQKHKKYKRAWVSYIGKDYRQDSNFQSFIKILHNKWKLGFINLSTAAASINKFRKDN